MSGAMTCVCHGRVPEQAPEAARQLVEELWADEPSARPTAEEVINRLRELQPGYSQKPSLPLSAALSDRM